MRRLRALGSRRLERRVQSFADGLQNTHRPDKLGALFYGKNVPERSQMGLTSGATLRDPVSSFRCQSQAYDSPVLRVAQPFGQSMIDQAICGLRQRVMSNTELFAQSPH